MTEKFTRTLNRTEATIKVYNLNTDTIEEKTEKFNGKLETEEIEKIATKVFVGSEFKFLKVVETKVTSTKYEMDIETFMKYATKTEC